MIITDGHMTTSSFPPLSDIWKARFYIMIAYNTELRIVWWVVGRRLFKSHYDLNHFALKETQISCVLFSRVSYLITALLHEIITKHVVSLLSLLKWNQFFLSQDSSTQEKGLKRSTVIDFLKWWGDRWGVKAEKVHFTSERVKIILHTNFNSWENTGTFNIKDL